MTTKNTEGKIASFFNRESSHMEEHQKENGIPESMNEQVRALLDEEVESVLDVGSGPGSLLLELAHGGVEDLVGMDLSPEMNTIAERRLKDEGFENIKIIQGSFLEEDLERQLEAISMHRVLCCHPNREGMLDQSMRYQPRLITLTIPRDWKILRLLVGGFGIMARLTHSFRPYIHTQRRVDQQLQKHGYQVIKRHKGWMWVTTTYRLQQ